MTSSHFSDSITDHASSSASLATQPASTRGGATATGVYVTVHGHFYQPPRENPYLNAIERQPSAAPYHNWNERIHHECYRPNAFARVLNDHGELLGVVNNFEYLSFNIGPTLMSWLEQADPEVYQQILEADRRSCERLGGHGNAIAQVYNHIIMPLANERDKYTQIRWGKADFRARFGREPEGMWLAETAVDYPTLKALVDEGIRFIILAPSQAQRCRPLPTNEHPQPNWTEVGGSQIDPSRPYRCYLNEPSGDRYIDIFFYDGPISRDMGFGEVMNSSQHFAARLGQAVRGDHRTAQLVSVATDGETFGHHKGGSEKALAYAFTREFPARGWMVTNFAHYLSLHPPTWEVVLKPVTAWSCSHGVDRWQEDCGCGGGGLWNQQWRRPLRSTLNWLRDRLIDIYETEGRRFFLDPWVARDEYIAVVGDRSSTNISHFLTRHQTHRLNHAERVDALRLLEMQRHALLMFTSCGWFFEEVSRPEGTQILRYAARALELAEEVTGTQLEREFIQRLGTIPSNVDLFSSGADIYHQLVSPSRINMKQVAAHYAISSLFQTYPQESRIYAYRTQQYDYQLRRMGAMTLAVGQLQLTSEITNETAYLVFAVLHLGGWDFYCCIQPFAGRRLFTQLKDELFEAFQLASAAQTIQVMNRTFGDQSYNLQHLFVEDRHRIMRQLSQATLTRLDQLYTQVYRDNFGVLMAFHRDGLDVPQELQVAAEIAISHRAMVSLQALERETSDWPLTNLQMCHSHLGELEAIANEARQLRCQIRTAEMRTILERVILRALWHLLYELDLETAIEEITILERLLIVGREVCAGLSCDRAQELYLRRLQATILPLLQGDERQRAIAQRLIHLGQCLSVDVTSWQVPDALRTSSPNSMSLS
ncbi:MULTISPECIES: DUF3536 domain-containing protein [unclassified Leptolyngbya]|uniref:DUF3536 domain-containing protein n=1 Tax=unclassified Leptolyngbya TaxID=2650499 RepID=UPI001683698C|nr:MULTISPECIES: DUF3536 domain-containing protein [unclassified Leptolyngbya]MBD1910295.1 DUF3536 domain-containing protein [Leptolyngbya sp. FACHB-8]MBD2155793.1 DUF3536 domain-containing protein [Leptolyngbya sp. FACHB-16]